jgi:4'-phosphopantetheinyl transferase EntD
MDEACTVRLSEAFGALFPAGVVAVELCAEGDTAALLPAEAECLGRSIVSRAREFAAGRVCARRALREFGVDHVALLVGEQREPLWPAGFVGSITHTTGLCAAAVAERRRYAGIGLDVEIAGRVKPELWPKVCVAEEAAWIASLPESERAAAATLIFAAKEAFYKAQFPLVREWVYFHDVCIEVGEWSASQAGFLVRPLRSLQVSQVAAAPLAGHYRRERGFLAAGIAIGAT